MDVSKIQSRIDHIFEEVNKVGEQEYNPKLEMLCDNLMEVVERFPYLLIKTGRGNVVDVNGVQFQLHERGVDIDADGYFCKFEGENTIVAAGVSDGIEWLRYAAIRLLTMKDMTSELEAMNNLLLDKLNS